MSDFWKGWMYAGLLVLAVMLLAPLGAEALQWRPDDSPPSWYSNLERGWLENAPFIVALVGSVLLVNLGFQIYRWFRRIIAEGDEPE